MEPTALVVGARNFNLLKIIYLCKKYSQMSSSDRSFSENLDLLIKLLRKLKDKSQFEGMPGVPKMFITNFDFFLQNYERMKDQITAQLLQQFGEPIKQMVADMVDQLQEELDEDLLSADEVPPLESPVITGHKKTIAEIDEQLKKPGLSEEEIDRLLDERKRLKSE
jgi:16S rRNA C967 or C1407 C5-methylase (RsmB/RsmF family)